MAEKEQKKPAKAKPFAPKKAAGAPKAAKKTKAPKAKAKAAEKLRYAHQLKTLLAKLGVVGKALVIDHEPLDALVLSGRNNPEVTVLDASHVTVYDVLDCKTVLVSQEGMKKLEERLAS